MGILSAVKGSPSPARYSVLHQQNKKTVSPLGMQYFKNNNF